MPTPSDDHHHDVMISSTSLDLPDHREAAIKAVLRSNLFPQVMETLTATSADPITDSLALVDCAEVYVGIFAFRYGYVPEDDARNPGKISITEMEYRRALERKIPCLIFIAHDEHPITIKDTEPDPDKKRRLDALKAELGTRHTCAFFKSPQELSDLMYQALQEELHKGTIHPRPPAANPHDATARTVPDMPEPYIVHPYSLTKKFFGRAKELEQLDRWGASADRGMIVDAIGGVGKSALTWHWVETGRAREHIKDLAGVVWFSFYESDATMGNFMRHTLAYLTGKTPDDFNEMRFDERERLLLQELRKRPVLLVLDGLERALVAYNRVDAPHLLDDEVESGTAKGAGIHAAPPIADGDAADEHTRREERSAHLRSFTNPREGDFLQHLMDCAPSKVLISTRLKPSALQADRHNPDTLCEGVIALHLNGLHPDDALALITHLGVRGDGDALKAFMAQFGNHSLLISVIAGRIVRYREQPGDFDAWCADEGRALELAGLPLEQKRTHILQYALAGLAPELRKLLGQVAAFRYPVDYAALSALNPYLPPKPEEVPEPDLQRLRLYQHYLENETKKPEAVETEEERERWRRGIELVRRVIAADEAKQAAYDAYQQALHKYEQSPELRAAKARFHAGLDELEDRGLLRWDRGANRYDLHPIVRAYSFEALDEAARASTYAAIRSHFEGLPPEDLDTVQDVSDLRRTLEIYYALINAGRLDDAARLYVERLGTVLHYHIAAYHLVVQLLTPLFPDGTDRLPALSAPEWQSAIVNDMANAFYNLGRIAEALVLEGLTIPLALERRAAPGLGVSLRNYALSLLADDRLAATERAYLLARDLGDAADDLYGLAMSYLFLLGLYKDTGQWVEAEAAYHAFSANPPTSQTAFWQADAEKYRAEALIARGLDAAEALDRAEQLAQQGRNALSLRVIARLRGEVALQAGDPGAAAEYFLRAVTLARKHGSSEAATYLGCIARTRAAQGRPDEARRLLAEAFAQPYNEEIHDLHNSAAEVYLALGEHDRAREQALAAYQSAWADGPPYTWWWGLDRAT
jgi:tetratricopeptide (TPR) repeat protein